MLLDLALADLSGEVLVLVLGEGGVDAVDLTSLPNGWIQDKTLTLLSRHRRAASIDH